MDHPTQQESLANIDLLGRVMEWYQHSSSGAFLDLADLVVNGRC